MSLTPTFLKWGGGKRETNVKCFGFSFQKQMNQKKRKKKGTSKTKILFWTPLTSLSKLHNHFVHYLFC